MYLPEETRPRSRIIIADPNSLIRAGLRAIFADDPEFDLVGEASNGHEAVALTHSMTPDLVVMEAYMPDMDDLEATRAVKAASPATTVLILSAAGDPRLLVAAVNAGAAGYVLKGSSEAALRSAMSAALEGNFPLDAQMVHEVLRRVPTDLSHSDPTTGTHLLSAREQEVLELLARGYTNREIGTQLVITPSTVKVHVEHILSKFGVSDRTQAAVQAIEMGYITPGRLHGLARPVEQKPAESREAC